MFTMQDTFRRLVSYGKLFCSFAGRAAAAAGGQGVLNTHDTVVRFITKTSCAIRPQVDNKWSGQHRYSIKICYHALSAHVTVV